MSRVVVTGAAGLLGRELCEAFAADGHEVIGLTHADIDLGEPASLGRITEARPDVIVNAAAWTDVDGCARDAERAMRINGRGPAAVGAVAARAGALMIQISTNEVFDGSEERPYAEDDAPNPINPYGQSKLAGERAVMGATDRHLIVRTAWLFGPNRGFPARIRAAAERAQETGDPLRVVEDEWGNPTPAPSLAHALVAAVAMAGDRSDLRVLHLAGEPPASRFRWAQDVLADHPVAIRPVSQAEFPRASTVPHHAVLATDLARALGLPDITWHAAGPGAE